MATDRFMARWDDTTPGHWHPRSRRHLHSQKSPWSQMEDAMKDMESKHFGKLDSSFENAMNLLHLNPPIGSQELMNTEPKPKKYKKKVGFFFKFYSQCQVIKRRK